MRLRRFCYVLVSEFVWFTGVVVGGMSFGWLAWLAYGESASCALLVYVVFGARLVCVLRICIIEIKICTITNV